MSKGPASKEHLSSLLYELRDMTRAKSSAYQKDVNMMWDEVLDEVASIQKVEFDQEYFERCIISIAKSEDKQEGQPCKE